MRCVLQQFALVLCVAIVAGATATSVARAADPEFTPQQRQAIESIIHDYLAKHPETLLDAMQAADDKLKKEAKDKAASALASHRQEILNDPETPVGGNPGGNVSVVEFFDYRCPYCKQVEPALESLLRQDPQLRFVYKEFPVLGPVSMTAAHAALAARKQGKYAAFHRAMMALKGQIDDEAVFAVASSVGLDVDRLKRDMEAPDIDKALKANFALADTLDITGTPGFVIGDQIIPEAVSLDELKQLIDAVRKKQAG